MFTSTKHVFVVALACVGALGPCAGKASCGHPGGGAAAARGTASTRAGIHRTAAAHARLSHANQFARVSHVSQSKSPATRGGGRSSLGATQTGSQKGKGTRQNSPYGVNQSAPGGGANQAYGPQGNGSPSPRPHAENMAAKRKRLLQEGALYPARGTNSPNHMTGPGPDKRPLKKPLNNFDDRDWLAFQQWLAAQSNESLYERFSDISLQQLGYRGLGAKFDPAKLKWFDGNRPTEPTGGKAPK
jgi:hypothetical protein